MNRRELNELSYIYTKSILLESKEGYTNQARKILQSFFYSQKNNKDFKSTLSDKTKSYRYDSEINTKVEDILNKLKKIVDESEPSVDMRNAGKGYEYLPLMSRFVTQGVDPYDMDSIYKNFVSLKTKEAVDERAKIHSYNWNQFRIKVTELENKQNEKNREYFKIDANTTNIKSIMNKAKHLLVYEDENVNVYRATSNDVIDSVQNCRLLGMGGINGECISVEGESAFSNYISYRFDKEYLLTTYYVYFKNPEVYTNSVGYVIIDARDEESTTSGKFSYNYISKENGGTGNADYPANDFNNLFERSGISPEERKKLLSVLEAPYQKDIFKALPQTEDEKKIYDTVKGAENVFDTNVIKDKKYISAFIALNGSIIKGGKPIDMNNMDSILNIKDEEIKKNLFNSVITLAPPMESYDVLEKFGKKSIINSYLSHRKLKLIAGLGIELTKDESEA